MVMTNLLFHLWPYINRIIYVIAAIMTVYVIFLDEFIIMSAAAAPLLFLVVIAFFYDKHRSERLKRSKEILIQGSNMPVLVNIYQARAKHLLGMLGDADPSTYDRHRQKHIKFAKSDFAIAREILIEAGVAPPEDPAEAVSWSPTQW